MRFIGPAPDLMGRGTALGCVTRGICGWPICLVHARVCHRAGTWIAMPEYHLRPHGFAAPFNGNTMFFTPFGYLLALSGAFRMANDAAIIIAARSPILVRAAMSPAQALDPEILRMMSEKVAAMLEGAIGAQHGMAYLAASALRGESLPKLLRRTSAIGMAGLRPARRRVRENAKRLMAGA